MDRARVTVHAMVSVDGRTDCFAGDVGLYYELAAGLPQDAVLSGSSTLLAAAEAEGIDLSREDPVHDEPRGAPAGESEVPLLVIVDGRGRLTRFDWLTALPYWRAVLVACTAATPVDHLALLDRHGIEHVTTGSVHVDLENLLQILAGRGVRRVRVDSGGVLNGALLRAGLVDEISVVLAPYAVGGRRPAGIFVADDLVDGEVASLELRSVERLRGDVVWLRYEVSPRS